jgi:hypothetical protein
MKACWGVDVQIHIYLTSAVLRGEWSISRPGRFTPRKELPGPLARRLGGRQSRSGRRGEEKIINPTGTWTPAPRSSSPLPVAIPTTLSLPHPCLNCPLKYLFMLKPATLFWSNFSLLAHTVLQNPDFEEIATLRHNIDVTKAYGVVQVKFHAFCTRIRNLGSVSKCLDLYHAGWGNS